MKIIISLLFLAVAAVAALLGITSFFPELFEQVKYGVKHIVGEPARKTPAFKKDKQENRVPIQDPLSEGRKYGVAPVRDDRIMLKYGVAPTLYPSRTLMYEHESKYGVEPIQMETEEDEFPHEYIEEKN